MLPEAERNKTLAKSSKTQTKICKMFPSTKSMNVKKLAKSYK